MAPFKNLPCAPLGPSATVRAAVVVVAALVAAVPLVAVSQTEATQDKAAPNAAEPHANPAGRFFARFSNGVELELIGVSTSPSAEKSWQAPDGKPLAAPYAALRPPNNVWKSPMLREFCWRWRGADDPDIRTSWNVTEPTNGWGPIQPAGPDGNIIKDLTAFVVPFSGFQPTCTLTFTLSFPGSKWQTYYQGQGGNVMANVSTPPGKEPTGVTIDKPRAMDGGSFVVMGYKFPQNLDARLIAVDGAGKRHVGKSEFAGGMMGVQQLAVHFAEIQPQEIKTWIVEQRLRLTETVEFYKVSLVVGAATVVEVVGHAADLPHSPAGNLVFGPAVEMTVAGNPRAPGALIDFDSGNLLTPPNMADAEGAKWVVDQGVDAWGDASDFQTGLMGFDFIAVKAEADDWDDPRKLDEYLAGAQPTSAAPIDASGPLPATYFFQTREGGRGILQITEVIPDEAVKLRYKLADVRPAK